MQPVDVVHRYFEAMQAGEEQADVLFELFAEDAIYVEPFTGAPRTHTGRAAIEQCMRDSWKDAPPDLELVVNRVHVDGQIVRSEWTCNSPVFETPVKGVDVCEVNDGLICRLEVAHSSLHEPGKGQRMRPGVPLPRLCAWIQ